MSKVTFVNDLLAFFTFTCIEWSRLSRCDPALSFPEVTAAGSQLPLNS